MSGPSRYRFLSRWGTALIGLGLSLTSLGPMAIGHQAPEQATPGVAEQVVARLRSACETEPGLRGALIQGGTLGDGTLTLSGTVDRNEQAGAIEARARQWLDDTPSWKQQIPHGVSAAKLVRFPVRSEMLPGLRQSFARSGADPGARPGLLQQTRIDELYFDAQGRLRAAGLCVNQGAYLARKGGTPAADEPLARIAQAIRDHLKTLPLPPGVDPNVIARLQADTITFEENPVRPLQRRANQSPQLDDVLFRDARFDDQGRLVIDGLLGDESQREQAAALLTREERAYGRPSGDPLTEPRASVAPMTVVPWRRQLIDGLRRRFARDANRGAPTDDLRYCRVDRATFLYPNQGGLLLRFEGVALRPDDESTSARIATGLRDECRGLFRPPIPIEYNIEERLTKRPSPVRDLQSVVASAPELDGVRLDDLVFGPAGEATFEGVWQGPRQQAALEAALIPRLSEATESKIAGPVAWRLKEIPTDQWLRELRGQVAADFDETSLDRLFFRPSPSPTTPPELILEAATIGSRRGEVESKLNLLLKEAALTKELGRPRIQFTDRPGSLVRELRKLAQKDKGLDGVRIDRGVFAEDNTFLVSGLQDHEGQAERVVSLAREAVAVAWPGLPKPAAIKAGTFTTHALRPLLEKLARLLPSYRETDGVLLNRAYYDADSSLVLAGPATVNPDRVEDLKKRIKDLTGIDVKLDLTHQAANSEAAGRIVLRAVEAAVNGNLSSFGSEALDQAILLDPADSSAWFLRAAYYRSLKDDELTNRDLRRVGWLERSSRSRLEERSRLLERFQGPLRLELEDMLRDGGYSRQ